jgi:hypothetical protein
VDRKNNPVSGVALKLADIPNSCGSHGMISDGDSVGQWASNVKD